MKNKDKKRNIAVWTANVLVQTGQAIVTRDAIEVLSPRVHALLMYDHTKIATQFYQLAKNTCLLARDITMGRVTVVYLVGSRSMIGILRDVPAYLAALFGVRVIGHYHGSDLLDATNSTIKGRLLGYLVRRLDVIVVPSSYVKVHLEDNDFSNVCVLENYASFTDVKIRNNGNSSIVVLWNSNVMASKGFCNVLEGCRQLIEMGHPVKMKSIGRPIGDHMMGQSELEAGLQQALKYEWFEYIGPVDRDTSLQQLVGSDIVCLPSLSECQPLSIIEAMIAGKGIVISSIPALVDTVGSYPHVKTKTMCGEDIAMAILEAAKISISADDIEKVRLRFSKPRFDRQLVELFTSVERN